MFGLGAGELLIIAIVALLALGPDKLPGAAKKIGKGIRDLKRQTRDLQTTIEHDSELGEAVRDLKSALRGEDPPPRPRPRPQPKPGEVSPAAAADAALAAKQNVAAVTAPETDADAPSDAPGDGTNGGPAKTSVNG